MRVRNQSNWLPRAEVYGSPSSVQPAPAGVELAKLPFGNRRAAARRLVRPRQHSRVAARIEHHPRLEHEDVGARLGQHLGGHPTTGP